ncbi:Elongation of very long chain fatty acids protein 4 [Araneus ventricosus]|uniref:Elongation of very long chain fatty acids protein n=1 Tax=Araneus ventricosus TaxID=182803 RepID=A0A4Y2KA05_ARAVE|nr:Elongation of very long chain fatty acids protein 4 [Araneus ventricosus]
MKPLSFSLDVENKLLCTNRYLLPSILIGYALFVTWIGPTHMRNRKAYNLRRVLVTYNFLEVIINAYIASRVSYFMINNRDLYCLSKIDRGVLFSQRFKHLGWLIFLNKVFDLFDTVFFVLRKKQNQVTILHVIHHALMPLFCWWGLRSLQVFGGFYLGVGLGMNAVVHTVMYLYYGLSALGPEMAKYLWWKKYITVMQIVQFAIFLVYMSFGFLTGCEQPGKMETTLFAFVSLMLILFINFYKKCK